jgi:hypothetical protein
VEIYKFRDLMNTLCGPGMEGYLINEAGLILHGLKPHNVETPNGPAEYWQDTRDPETRRLYSRGAALVICRYRKLRESTPDNPFYGPLPEPIGKTLPGEEGGS